MDEAIGSILLENGFSIETFASLANQLRQHQGALSSIAKGELAPPGSGDIIALSAPGTPEHRALVIAGREAIARGQVGAVVLAGGMGTRFGGVVKAEVPALDGRSFLDLKLAAISREAALAGGTIPVLIMTSVFTDARVKELIARLSYPNIRVKVFRQSAAFRLTPSGEVHRDRTGSPSLYATGHGDLTFSLRRSGHLESFLETGGGFLAVSNVDNLPATPAPAIIGAHLHFSKEVTVEVADKHPGDHGGGPVWLDGRLQIVEDFRLPADFDRGTTPVLNTNTFVLSASAINREFDFDWFAVRKQVDGSDVVQFERLLGQITAFLSTLFLHVPRTGTGGRFLPVKDPEELNLRRPEIRTTLHALGIV